LLAIGPGNPPAFLLHGGRYRSIKWFHRTSFALSDLWGTFSL
jgi:hypothetical protein